MCASVALARHRVCALLDTGAARSMITLECLRKAFPRIDLDIDASPGITLKSLSGHVLPTFGVVSVPVYGLFVEFYVVESLSHEILLGSDALRTLRAVINYNTNTVILAGMNIPCYSASFFKGEISQVTADIDKWAAMYPRVFSSSEAPLRTTSSVEMTIDTGEARPIRQKPYRLPLAKRQIVDIELEKMLRDDIIEHSASAWASPITLVPKPDGSTRFCTDYRKLNAVTKKDAHPLPDIRDIFDNLAGATVFSTCDLRSGYWQIPMRPEDREKTAFICHKGLFQFKRMSFGLCNAPAVFQRFMNHVLAPYIGSFLMVYLDDIVCYSRSQEEHEEHLHLLFQALEQHGLQVKRSKCFLNMPKVKLLGHIISKEGVATDPEKTEAIAKMAPPTDVSGVRSFLGMAGYYRTLIPNYAQIAGPLVELTRKHTKFKWGPRQHTAWSWLRDELTSDRIMAHPDPTKPYRLYTDACDYAIGAILVQVDENGVERPIQYLSKQLSGSQLSWPTIEKEGYSVVYALTKLRPYLHGADFVIYTDHKPLKSLFLQEVKNTRIQRWAVLLAEYGAPIMHRAGKLNVKADMLSRLRPSDEAQVGAMEEEHLIPWLHYGLNKDEIKRESVAMPEYRLAEEKLRDFCLHNGLVYSLAPIGRAPVFPRLVLPPAYREQVIKQVHLDLAHQGVAKMLPRIQEHFLWEGMHRQVTECLARCTDCLVVNPRRERPPPGEMPVAEYFGHFVSIDITGPFVPSANGNRYVLCVLDHATLWPEVKPLKDKSAKSVLDYLANEYVPRYGPPSILLSDQGGEFRNALVGDYLASIQTEVRQTTPYHPQSNGRVERFFRTLKGMLKKLVNSKTSEWEEALGPAIYAHRIAESASSKFSPYFLLYGRQAPMPGIRPTPRKGDRVNNEAAERAMLLARSIEEAKENILDSRRYNLLRLQRQANAEPLSVGDRVVIVNNETASLDPPFDHVFLVTRVLGNVISLLGPNHEIKNVNRDKVRKVPAGLNWGDRRRKQPRVRNRQTVVIPGHVAVQPVGGALGDQRRAPPAEVNTSTQPTAPPPADPADPALNQAQERARDVTEGGVPHAQTHHHPGPSGEATPIQHTHHMVTRSRTKRPLQVETPSEEEVITAKRQCIAAVSLFFGHC